MENISLFQLLTEIISEVGEFNNIEPYKYITNERGGEFKTDEGNRVTVSVTEWPLQLYKNFEFPPIVDTTSKPMYNIGYSVEGEGDQFIKTNYKTLIKILKTVSLIIEYHLKQLDYKNPIFTVFATGKKGKGHEDPQKTMLYKEILSKNLPSNYRIGMGKYLTLNSKFIFISK